ncbi:MAG: formylmethanofuran dehydrogenase subunit A [Candidatus Lokiarchaeota archaeon]|nr:formylmethanofuran dehydrogenase subunit A [Candidatus Lokiarchaeota archaeon]
MSKLIIKNGTVYDPLNKINGEKKDIFIENGKVVEEFSEKDAKIIDAHDKVVMPGGVDIHTHISGAKVNKGRLFRPEDHLKDLVYKTKVTRSGTGYSVPTTFATGYRYAKMGYTTLVDPAMAPLKAKHTHEEFADTPIVDKMAYPLFGNNWFVMEYIKNGEFEKLKAYIAWLLKITKGYAIKIVNPGGVESWGWGKNCESLDEKVMYFEVTPAQILENLSRANEELGLPHTIHVHANNLGHPGNSAFTLKTFDLMKKVNPTPSRDSVLHLTHCQFNAYGGSNWKNFCSGAPDIADYLNNNKHITIDIGQVIFTNTTTMTADGPWEFQLHGIGGFLPWGVKPGVKWINGQVEGECGSGLTPYIFNPKNATNSIQFTIGLELMLLCKDPQQVFLTTDHPNGGPFIYYPTIIKWLMNKKSRDEKLKSINKAALSKSGLIDIDREYTLEEIAWVTRAGTAQCLGIGHKGHLGVGADGDVSVYDVMPGEKDGEKIEKAFSDAAYTVKGGQVVTRDGDIIKDVVGTTMYSDVTDNVKPDLMDSVLDDIKSVWQNRYSINFDNYKVQEIYCEKPMVIRGK